MGTRSVRKKTTEYASKIIDSYLHKSKPEYTVALLLSSIYADIRLRTLLTDLISPTTKNKWEITSSEILGKLNLMNLINLCYDHKLINKNQKKNLHALRVKRNKVAHESELWKRLSEDDQKEIENLCKFTIQFLEKTKH